MSTSKPPAGRADRRTATDPTSATAGPRGGSDGDVVAGAGGGPQERDSPEGAAPDVRSGGHSRQGPRSLAQAEARWQDHESSGAAWDSGDSI